MLARAVGSDEKLAISGILAGNNLGRNGVREGYVFAALIGVAAVKDAAIVVVVLADEVMA